MPSVDLPTLRQRAWLLYHGDDLTFAETGDLSTVITDHFDLVSAGPKREASSYELIAERVGNEQGAIACFRTSLELRDHEATRAALRRLLGSTSR